MAEAIHPAETSHTVTLSPDTTDNECAQDVAAVRLKLTKAKKDKKVNWTEGTVDNEHLNRKKSKCCCIYTKPRSTLDSSSDEDDDLECDHCRGHVEMKKKHASQDPGSEPKSPQPAASA